VTIVRILVVAAVTTFALCACGERPQVVNYKQGSYQGKPDSPPYNAQFGGDRTKWENEIRSRNQAQNEYKRTN
jgi:hypothetical protein